MVGKLKSSVNAQNSKHKVLYNVTRALVSLEIASLVVIADSQIKNHSSRKIETSYKKNKKLVERTNEKYKVLRIYSAT